MNAEFVISNTDISKCPHDERPEYAFIGRSNVGKSSLINMLVAQKGLAKTSATPGKTLLINHFLVDKEWYIVDLPGYGFAKIGKKAQEQLRRLIMSYVLRREQMTLLFVLIDSRHAPLDVDLEFMRTLGANGIPFAIVFTKLDKLSRRQWTEHLDAYKQRLLEEWEELPPIFATSAETKSGREELLQYISEVNASLQKK